MEKKLSAWCKNAKIEMINRDLKTTTLAKELDMNRSYVSSILNGRVYSAPAVKKISDYLGIADSDTTTVCSDRGSSVPDIQGEKTDADTR